MIKPQRRNHRYQKHHRFSESLFSLSPTKVQTARKNTHGWKMQRDRDRGSLLTWVCSRAPLRDVAFSIFAFANATWHLATLHTPPPPPARLDKPKDARLGQGSSRRRTAEAKTVSAACGLSRMQRGGSNQTTQRRQQVNKSLHRVDIASTATSQSPSGGCTVQSTSVYDKH